jgi:hypothetical protein
MTTKDHNAQKARRFEHGFVWFIVTLIVLVNLFVIVPASEAVECHGAHISACEDLVGAEVTFKQVGTTSFQEVCGKDVDACAVLNVTRKQCTIYYRTRYLEKKVLDHEMNHCRGWFHKQNRASKYNRPWVDLDTYLGG